MNKKSHKEWKEAYSSLLQKYFHSEMNLIASNCWGKEWKQAEYDLHNKVDTLSKEYLNKPFKEEI